MAIARAIVTDPYLLVADEPTGDLDRQSAGEILELLQALNRDFQKTIVMVTHDPQAAAGASGAASGQGEARGRRLPGIRRARSRVMKYLGYVPRNARRNPVRSLLTVASIAVCLFLMMILISFLTINDEVASSLRIYNRIITMSSQGLAQPVPISRVAEIAAMDGVVAASPFSWYGGKYGEDPIPFAQFGIDPDTIFYDLRRANDPPRAAQGVSGRPGRLHHRHEARRGLRSEGRRPVAPEGGPVPVRPGADGSGHLRRSLEPGSAHGDVPLGLSGRGAQTGSPGADVGQCGNRCGEGQECRPDGLLEQGNRCALPQQRHTHTHADRGGVREDVRRDVRRHALDLSAGSVWRSCSR